jgi:hypothetical protein
MKKSQCFVHTAAYYNANSPVLPRFRHSVFGGSGKPCARNAVRKCIFETFFRPSTPYFSRLINSFAAEIYRCRRPLGQHFIPYSFSNAPKRVTNSFLAKIDAAATTISSSALCLCTNSISRPKLINAFATVSLLDAN